VPPGHSITIRFASSNLRRVSDSFVRPLVLGIETSCDDTACALVDGEGRVLASVVSSQLAAHRPFGGVVPEIASREHLRNWPWVRDEALAQAGVEIADVDAVAATRGPGLVGALLVGLSMGRAIAWGLGRGFHAMHHLEGHLYSPFLGPAGEPAESIPERFIGLVVSGGHTSLFEVEGGTIRTLAETRDDAIGEAFDKLGKRLGLPYPQGPHVDRLAETGDPARSPLPIPSHSGEIYFSYSGLKTQAISELERRGLVPSEAGEFPPPILDTIAGFRAAAVGQILDRLARFHRRQPIPLLAVSGGVAANRLLRSELERWAAREAVPLRLVALRYSGDNAAMIAHVALQRERRGQRDDPRRAAAESRIAI
jgi:N6-L-threonylcarbamoyladenine synthase